MNDWFLFCPLFGVGWDSSVGIATCYRLEGPGLESCRFQWPSGVRQGSAADRLLGLRFRIWPRAWMFVLCVVSRGKMQDNQDNETSTGEVQSTREYKKKKVSVGATYAAPVQIGPGAHPASYTINWYRVSFPGVKRLGRGFNHPPPSSAEVKESVELYIYSPSGPS